MMGVAVRVTAFLACIAALCPPDAARASAPPAPGATLDWAQPWVQPHDALAAAEASDEYAWRVFIAINWPAQLRTGGADAQARLGADAPAAWETWENTANIFRADGADPGPWQMPDNVQGPATAARFETLSLKDLPNLRHIVAGRMVPLVDPLAGARRLTEVRMNRAGFEYIREHELYNVDGQLRMVAGNRAVRFPAATTEVKAKWRPIGADDRIRYHTLEVRQPDGSTRLYGLTALHIVTKDLPDGFWATFEHVDNPGLADSEGWLLPSSDRFACGQTHPDCNRAPEGVGLDASVWRFYRLRGTLTRYVDAGGQPLRLANSELEAGMQLSASCITCHARASIGAVADAPARLSVFDSTAPAQGRGLRVGFIGAPRAAWFMDGGADADAHPMFFPQDFVWSLSQAQPKRGSR